MSCGHPLSKSTWVKIVGCLKTSSKVNSSGKCDSEKTLLCKLALQPTDETVPKSVIEEVAKFAGRCLAELHVATYSAIDSNGSGPCGGNGIALQSPAALARNASSTQRKGLLVAFAEPVGISRERTS